MKYKKLVFFSYHYPPDQSAGAYRAEEITKKFLDEDPNLKIWVLTSRPNRYIKLKNIYSQKNRNLKIIRFWVPYLGLGHRNRSIAYLFYFLQSVPKAIFIRPNIILATSAKLLTSFAATCAAKLSFAKLFIDYRDTLSDNYFYLYRWTNKIFLHIFIVWIENIVFKTAYSINIVSYGFKDIFLGLENHLKKNMVKFTYFTNGIKDEYRNTIIKRCRRRNNLQKTYNVVYAGNLGDGQDILGLLEDLFKKQKNIEYFLKNDICLNLFGSGPQEKKIKEIIQNNQNFGSDEVVKFIGLIKKEDMPKIYEKADCLFLQLAKGQSLSMVIPSKIFEYSATNYPILFAASGFTKEFIEQVNGSLYFEQNNSTSFIKALKKSRKIKVNYDSRTKFLRRFNTNQIFEKYVKHILNS